MDGDSGDRRQSSGELMVGVDHLAHPGAERVAGVPGGAWQRSVVEIDACGEKPHAHRRGRGVDRERLRRQQVEQWLDAGGENGDGVRLVPPAKSSSERIVGSSKGTRSQPTEPLARGPSACQASAISMARSGGSRRGCRRANVSRRWPKIEPAVASSLVAMRARRTSRRSGMADVGTEGGLSNGARTQARGRQGRGGWRWGAATASANARRSANSSSRIVPSIATPIRRRTVTRYRGQHVIRRLRRARGSGPGRSGRPRPGPDRIAWARARRGFGPTRTGTSGWWSATTPSPPPRRATRPRMVRSWRSSSSSGPASRCCASPAAGPAGIGTATSPRTSCSTATGRSTASSRARPGSTPTKPGRWPRTPSTTTSTRCIAHGGTPIAGSRRPPCSTPRLRWTRC